MGFTMKNFGVSLAIMVASGAAAHAADLPTTKAPVAPPPNCYASLWTWLNSTPADCPLSYAGFTLYGTIDAGVGYESNGAGYNQYWNNGVSNIVTKQSTHGPQWLWTPNGLSQSVVGIKMSEPLWNSGWSLIGVAETGFNPYSFNLAYAQKSQVQNQGKSLFAQNANADSSRTGQPFNSQVYIGVSNKEYGTLIAGRVYDLSLDGINAYDPMGGSYAFSPLGYSGSYAGFGDTEGARANTALKYRVEIQNFRLGGLWQWGGYDQGNGTAGLYQGQVGGDFHIPDFPNTGAFPNFGGGLLSLDAIGSYGKDEVNLGTFGTLTQCATLKSGPFQGQTSCSYDSGASGTIPLYYNNTDFQATLSDNIGLMLLGKYKWQQWTLYGGYSVYRQSNPSGNYQNGFETIGYFNVPGTIPGSNVPGTIANKLWPTQWVVNNAYNVNRIANFWWTGIRYDITPQLDVVGAFYILGQNDYNFSVNSKTGITTTAACTTTATNGVQPNGTPFTIYRLNSSKCAGSTDFISFLIDYRPVKRVDLYAGVMVSNVYGGLANGYYKTQNIDPTVGIRVKF
jgi:predicted porin